MLVALTPGDAPKHYTPVVDQAGTGNLMAVLDSDGNLVERVVYADAFGASPRYLHGAVLDRIAIRDNSGGREITLHFTEQLDASTAATGAKLVALDANGVTLRSVSGATASEQTLTFKLSSTDWTQFTAGATTLQIGANNSLRFKGWGDRPLLPAEEWQRTAGKATSGVENSFLATYSLLQLQSELQNASTSESVKIFELGDPTLAASSESASHVLFAFQGLPYAEPATGAVNARARWFDAATGAWLSPDPLGYRDSANLYAFCAGDPVNGRDPEGEGLKDGTIGFLRGVGKAAVGAGTGLVYVARVATLEPTALRQLPGVARAMKNGVAEWGTEAGTFLGDPRQALSDLSDELVDQHGVVTEVVGGATFDTALIVSPLAKAKTPVAPRFKINLAHSSRKIRPPVPGLTNAGLIEIAEKSAPRGGAQPVRMGQAGEAVGTEVSGYAKNTRRIPSASGKKAYRIPDHMNDTGRHIVEDKAVQKQHLSSQIKDYKAYVLRDDGAGRVEVLVDETTEITPQLLREHLNPGSPIKLRSAKLKKN